MCRIFSFSFFMLYFISLSFFNIVMLTLPLMFFFLTFLRFWSRFFRWSPIMFLFNLLFWFLLQKSTSWCRAWFFKLNAGFNLPGKTWCLFKIVYWFTSSLFRILTRHYGCHIRTYIGHYISLMTFISLIPSMFLLGYLWCFFRLRLTKLHLFGFIFFRFSFAPWVPRRTFNII